MVARERGDAMGNEVYADLLFLVNFSMDFLCFYFLCLLLHKRLPVLRVCVASALGGAYSVASLFINSGAHLRFGLDVSVPVLMCIIAFASRKIRARDIVKSVLMYFFVEKIVCDSLSHALPLPVGGLYGNPCRVPL